MKATIGLLEKSYELIFSFRDALCLGILLQPDKPNTIRMKSRLEKIAQPVKSGKVHKVVELLELMKENGFVGYKDNLLGEVDPVTQEFKIKPSV